MCGDNGGPGGGGGGDMGTSPGSVGDPGSPGAGGGQSGSMGGAGAVGSGAIGGTGSGGGIGPGGDSGAVGSGGGQSSSGSPMGSHTDDPAETSEVDTGNFSGMATGFGVSGYGDISEGKPGIFGGEVTEAEVNADLADFAAHNLANALAQSNAQAIENEAQVGVSGVGLSTTPEQSAYALAVLAENKALQANAQLTNSIFSNLSIRDRHSFAREAYSIPLGMSIGFSFSGIGLMATVGKEVAAALAALTGVLVGEPWGDQSGSDWPALTETQKQSIANDYNITTNQVEDVYEAMKIGEVSPVEIGILGSESAGDTPSGGGILATASPTITNDVYSEFQNKGY